MNLKITDYESRFASEIDEMELNQWGDWGDNQSIDELSGSYDIIRVATIDDEFVGVAYGKLKDDYFWIHVICIIPKFQKHGFGTQLLQDIIEKAKAKFNINCIKADSVFCNGKSNSKRMLEKAGFKIVGSEQNFWGKDYPDVLCIECNKKPCECTALFYELKV